MRGAKQMAVRSMETPSNSGSLRSLLHPRGQIYLFVGAAAIGLLAAWLGMTRLNIPLWSAAVGMVVLLSYPAMRKWQADRQQLGTPAMVLSILLVTQSLHTV